MVLLAGFGSLTWTVGSILGPDDRPYMKRPEDKTIRVAVGSWFRGVRR